MPAEGSGRSFSPPRVTWPRMAASGISAPALAALPARPFDGRSRFVLAPLSLSLDQLLFLITSALLCFGLIMVQSADARIRTTHDNWLAQSFSNKNAIHAALALLALTATWRMDYRWLLGKSTGRGDRSLFAMLLTPAAWLVILTAAFLVAVLTTPLGRELNGARRWFGYGAFGFQPSELAKLSLVLFVSAYAVHRADVVRSFWKGFLPLMAVFGFIAALVVKEDFGTTVLLAAVVLSLILMAGCRVWHLALLTPGLAAVVYHMLNTPFRQARLMAFMHPEADPRAGYHPLQSLLTIISGGFWGRGLGNGILKMGYLPEDNTDFIFAVVCEELGFVGAAMVIALFAAFVLVGWRITCRCHSLFGKMAAFGITAVIGLQAAINIAVVTVSMPTKGIALPLISSGGTGWIMNAAAIGVLMSIERGTRRAAESALLADRGVGPGQGFPVELSVPAMPVVPAVPV